jgi:hypothetical protein
MAHPPLDERALDAAVAAGIVDSETRERLVGFAAAWREGRAAQFLPAGQAGIADDEQFRLLTGFNDVFVAIAIGILLWAVGAIGVAASPAPAGEAVVGGLALSGASWVLAEYFTRRRRMSLPSIELLMTFVGGVYWTAFGLLLLVLGIASGDNPLFPKGNIPAAAGNMMVFATLLVPTIIAIAAAFAHWRRFRVPITLAPGCAVIILPVMAVLGSQFGQPAALIAGFVGGVAAFLLAMQIDATDRARLTRRTDMAFWLHLLAAPLIVHPMLSQLQAPANPTLALVAAAATILIYLVLGLIALAVDRRALLVSGLVYVIYALGTVIQSGADPGTGFMMTALVVGGSLVLLAAAWGRARRTVIRGLPADLQALLPPVV